MKKYTLFISDKNLILSEREDGLVTTYFNGMAAKKLDKVIKKEYDDGKAKEEKRKLEDGNEVIVITSGNGVELVLENAKESLRLAKKLNRQREVRVQKAILIGAAGIVVGSAILTGFLKKKGKEPVLSEGVTVMTEAPERQPTAAEIIQIEKERAERQALEAKLREIDKKLSDDMWRQAKIDSMPKEENESFEVKLSKYVDILPVGDTKDVTIEIDGIPNNYDEELDRKVERYSDIIKDVAERVGLPEGVIKDPIKQESSGGDGNNIMQIEKGAWLDQEISCYDYKEQRFTSYVLTEHPENHQRIKNIITPEMLNDPFININFGANTLKWCIVNSRNNLPVGITLYNGGWHEVMEKTIPNTAKALGITPNEVLDNESDLTFLNYIDYPAGWGDKEYFQHVMGKATNENTVNYDGYVYINRNGEKCTKNYEINLTRLKKY